MSKLPKDKYKLIQKEIDKLNKNFVYLPDFIIRITNIIEEHFGEYSSQAFRLFEIQNKIFIRDLRTFQQTQTINVEQVENSNLELVSELMSYIKTLKPSN